MKSFIAEIQEKGVMLEVVDGDLRYRGPKGAVNAEILSRLKQHKAEIINLLTGAESAASDPIKRTCQSCRACAHWRGAERCFARALFDGKPGAPGPIQPEPCGQWQAV